MTEVIQHLASAYFLMKVKSQQIYCKIKYNICYKCISIVKNVIDILLKYIFFVYLIFR